VGCYRGNLIIRWTKRVRTLTFLGRGGEGNGGKRALEERLRNRTPAEKERERQREIEKRKERNKSMGGH